MDTPEAPNGEAAQGQNKENPNGPGFAQEPHVIRVRREAVYFAGLQSPKGDNAYEKYHSALEIDPDNKDAKRGLVKVAGRYLDLTEGALDSGDLEQARTYLGRAASIAPHHPRLPDVRDSVAQASSGAASGS